MHSSLLTDEDVDMVDSVSGLRQILTDITTTDEDQTSNPLPVCKPPPDADSEAPNNTVEVSTSDDRALDTTAVDSDTEVDRKSDAIPGKCEAAGGGVLTEEKTESPDKMDRKSDDILGTCEAAGGGVLTEEKAESSDEVDRKSDDSGEGSLKLADFENESKNDADVIADEAEERDEKSCEVTEEMDGKWTDTAMNEAKNWPEITETGVEVTSERQDGDSVVEDAAATAADSGDDVGIVAEQYTSSLAKICADYDDVEEVRRLHVQSVGNSLCLPK